MDDKKPALSDDLKKVYDQVMSTPTPSSPNKIGSQSGPTASPPTPGSTNPVIPAKPTTPISNTSTAPSPTMPSPKVTMPTPSSPDKIGGQSGPHSTPPPSTVPASPPFSSISNTNPLVSPSASASSASSNPQPMDGGSITSPKKDEVASPHYSSIPPRPIKTASSSPIAFSSGQAQPKQETKSATQPVMNIKEHKVSGGGGKKFMIILFPLGLLFLAAYTLFWMVVFGLIDPKAYGF